MHRKYNEDLFESTKMTFGEHLEELRRALVKAVLALIVGFGIGLAFAGNVVDYVQTPLKHALEQYYVRQATEEYLQELEKARAQGGAVPQDIDAAARAFAERRLVTEEWIVNKYELAEALPELIDESALPPRAADQVARPEDLVTIQLYKRIEDDPRVRIVGLRMEEPFVVYIKAALVLGAVIASPFIFYFIWQFVAAGLYPHEQRYVQIFLPFSIGLFLAGAALAFFVVFRFVLAFLLSFFDWMNIDPDPRISDWLNFVLVMPLGFGISFQLPLVMLFLERIGIFSVSTYLGNWRMAVLVIAFLSMILTPSDPYSMMLMAGPLIGLYFFGVLLCRWMPKRTTPFGEVIE